MKKPVKEKFFLVAGHTESLLNFRGPLIKALINEGFEIHAAAPCLEENDATIKALEDLGVNLHNVSLKRTSINPFNDLKTLYQLTSLMLKIKPSYILGYTHKSVIYGNLAALIARVPNRYALITGLGYTFQSNILWLNYTLKKLYKITLRNAAKVIFQNPDDEKFFYKLGIINKTDQKSIVVNGSGIDLKKFEVEPLPNNIQFLTISRFLGDKGVREYFKATKIVQANYPDINFGLVGWIDDHPDAISKEELDYFIQGSNIKFYGRLNDVRPAIRESSVYVLASYREGTPRTVLESMAMGRPIITTDAPGCKETVINDYNGFIVPVKSVNELADAMIKFIEEPELIKSMGISSRNLAEKKFKVEKVNKDMFKAMGLKVKDA